MGFEEDLVRFRRATSSDHQSAGQLFREVGYMMESAYAPGSLLAWSTFISSREVTLSEVKIGGGDERVLVAVIVRPRAAEADTVTVVHRAKLGKSKAYEPLQIRAIRHEITRRARAAVAARPKVTFLPPVEKR